MSVSLRRLIAAGALVPAAILPLPALADTFDTGLGFAVGVEMPQYSWDFLAVGTLRLVLGIITVFLVVQAIKAYFILETEGGNADIREAAFGMIKDSAVGLIIVVISSSVLPTIVSIVLRTTGLIS